MNKSFSKHFQKDRKSELRNRIAEKKALEKYTEVPQGSELAKKMRSEEIEQFVNRFRRK